MKKEKIDISSKWETQLPMYLELYSKLSDEGKKEMQHQVKVIGALVLMCLEYFKKKKAEKKRQERLDKIKW